MRISFSFIPGVMVGFEFVDVDEYDDDSSSSYFVLDLLLIRMLIEY